MRMEGEAGPVTLSAEANQALERLWAAAPIAGRAGSAPMVREAATVLTTFARQQSLHPEQLILLVKQNWNASSSGLAMHHRRVSQSVLDEFVTQCVSTFFDNHE
jgi:hypothetical protein